MSTSTPYPSRLPIPPLPPHQPDSDNRHGAHLTQFHVPDQRNTVQTSRATGYTNGRGIEAAFERSYEENRNKRPRTDYNGGGMMSSAHDEAMMSPPRLPMAYSYGKSHAYPPAYQNLDGSHNISSSSTPAMPTLQGPPQLRPSSADGFATVPRATTAHPFDRPPQQAPGSNSGQPALQHRYTQSQHQTTTQPWRDGPFDPYNHHLPYSRPHSVHDRSQSHHQLQNEYNHYANDNSQRRDRGMTVDGAMTMQPLVQEAKPKSMSISSILERPADVSTNPRNEYWQPPAPRNNQPDREDVFRTQQNGGNDANQTDRSWNGGPNRVSRGFTIGTAPADFAQSLDRIKQESLSPELRRSTAKLYKPAESEESSFSGYGRRSSFDSALPGITSRPPIFPTPPNDHELNAIGARPQRPISQSQSAPRSPLGLSHRRLKTASGYELPAFVQPPPSNSVNSYSGYPHPPLLPEGFNQTNPNGIISFSGYPHPPLLPDARFPIPSIEDRQLPSLQAATGFKRNQDDDEPIAVYGPHLQNVAYGPELPPNGIYRRQEHDTLPPLHTFDNRSSFHPPMAYTEPRHERSALTPSEPGDSPLLRRAALYRAQGGLTPTRQRSLQGFDNSRRSSLAKVLAYNPAARSSITPSREGTPQHPRITNLNLRDELRRGRMSPTPQAVQGAAQQSRGPTTDPGIRQEFGKLFSGIGSGLGSASSTPAPEDIPALRSSPILSRNRPTPLRNGTNSEDRFRSASRNALKRPREGTDGSGENGSATELIGSYGLIRSLSERSAKKGRTGPEPIRRPSIPHQNQSESGQNRRSAYPSMLTPNPPGMNGNVSPSNGYSVPTIGPPPAQIRRSETTVPTGNGPSVHHHHHHHHHPANPHHHHHHHHYANRAPSGISPVPVLKPARKRVVDSSSVLSQAATNPRTHLGFMTYSSELVPDADEMLSTFRKTLPCQHRPIPLFAASQVNSTYTIRVPSLYLSGNPFLTVLEDHALWGTDIYADDSDPIAAAVHAGFILNPHNSEPASLEFVDTVHSQHPETPQIKPGHEAHITVVILPTLEMYAPSTNYGIKSREWKGTRHDGMSFMVLNVEWLEKDKPRNRKE